MGMCGPSSEEKQAQAGTAELAKSMAAAFNTRFAQQSQLLGSLNTAMSPIVAAGSSQQGMSAQELATLNTQAINSASAANRNAQMAAGNVLAGRGGGGTSGLISGPEQAIRAGISSDVANTLATNQLGITAENYAVGRENYNKAVAGELALSGEYNPQSFGQGATTAFGQSFGEASQINKESQAFGKDILNAGLAVAGGAGSFITGGMSNVLAGGAEAGSETGGQF